MVSAVVVKGFAFFVHFGFPVSAVHLFPVPPDPDFPHTHIPFTHTFASLLEVIQFASEAHFKAKKNNFF